MPGHFVQATLAVADNAPLDSVRNRDPMGVECLVDPNTLEPLRPFRIMGIDITHSVSKLLSPRIMPIAQMLGTGINWPRCTSSRAFPIAVVAELLLGAKDR